MKRLCGGLVLAGLMIGAGGARADTLTVQKLLEHCNSSEPQWSMFCTGYIGGLADMMFLNGSALEVLPQSARSMKGLSLCGVTASYGALVQVFKNWAQANPKEWTESSSTGVVLALRGTWGCP